MKIRSILFALLGCVSFSLAAQTALQVEGSSPNLYLVHTVVSKENWYSIGRLYNLSPKELAPFNQLGMDKPLEIGQLLRIPLKPANFSQDNTKTADEVFVPVYYAVQEREWMYRISQNHNKVPIERLEQWNNITNNDIRPGMQLIVGYLKVKPGQSALASQSSSIRITAPVAKTSEHSIKSTETAVVSKPEQKSPDEHKTKTEEPKREIARTAGENKIEDKPLIEKPELKPIEKENRAVEKENRPVENKPVEARPVVNYQGGFFRALYGETGKGTSGAAGVFRSTSGWQDGKYYALMNNIPVGTIIRVANPSNGKSVYAKVLGNLPDMKESLGLTLRISDAAATELGLAANKFPVSVRY
jgi:LysM repeat protein